MMREIRLATIGEITAGVDAGRYVEVLDDWDATGGFLILTYDNRDRSGDAYDAWVESIVDVELFFDEARWEIRWVDD